MSKRKYVWLDLARGLAALAVAAGHLRAFALVDLHDVEKANIFWKLFYFATSLGPQAVMVFFVMSGFLVGKQVYQSFNANRWSWTDYAIKRLSRLWIVLFPALILTAAWDYIGIVVYHGDLYAGLLNDVYLSVPTTEYVDRIYRLHTFVGNALFLQTIAVPTFGTNGPLWSLANEFWYYVIFPLGLLATRKQVPSIWRLASAGLALAICLALPGKLVLYGVVWLLGFCVVLVDAHANIRLRPAVRRTLTIASIILFTAVLIIIRVLQMHNSMTPDFICGISFSILLYFLTKIHVRSGILSRGSKVLSEFSYTLYLTHFPFVALLSCAILGSTRRQPSGAALAVYVGLLCLTVLYAFAIYLLFERNTKSLQTVLAHRFGLGPPRSAIKSERADAPTPAA